MRRTKGEDAQRKVFTSGQAAGRVVRGRREKARQTLRVAGLVGMGVPERRLAYICMHVEAGTIPWARVGAIAYGFRSVGSARG